MRTSARILTAQLAAVAALLAAETGYSLFQKALAKERAEADLAGAIRLYERVVKEHARDRKLAAEALFRIGECHQALGNAEARRAFERLVRDFPDQADVAAKARAKLAALGAAEGKPKFTKIRIPTKLPGQTAFALSPDGWQLAYVADRSLWLLPVHGEAGPDIAGAARRITPQMNLWVPRRFTDIGDMGWSQDGKWIAVQVTEHPVGGRWEPLIYLVPSEGGEPVKLTLEPPNRLHDQRDSRLSLSPDGKLLAYTAWKGGETFQDRSIYVAPVKGGSARQLTGPATQQPAFSPDGKIGLMLRPPDVTRLYTVPAAGGVALQITATHGWVPAWSPDAKRIYFLDDRLESLQVVPAAGGKVTRIPIRGEHPLHISYPTPVSVSPDATKIMFEGLYVGKLEARARVFTVPIAGGTVTELATAIGSPGHASWSPDGKWVAFSAWDEVRKDVWGPNIFVVPAAGGQPRRVTSEGDFAGCTAWSPDGKHIAYYSRDNSVKLVPAEGGPSRVLVTGVKGSVRHSGLSWSPNARELAYGSEGKIWKISLETGKSEEVKTGLDAVHFHVAWSPDGNTIAFSGLQGGGFELWLMEDFLPLLTSKR